jgi:hypothetical protein
VAGVSLPEMSPWNRRTLTIPPSSVDAWIRLAIWELWMGMLVCVVLGLGVLLITTAPTHIVAVTDLTSCYAAPPVPQPCEQIVYRGGALNVAFTALCGLMLIGVALWLLWELWSAAAPKPITDDFLKLLNDSFGRSWHRPSTWPWARVLWAYGFALLGGTLTAGVAVMVGMLLASTPETTTPRIDTSQTFRLGASPSR